MIKGIYINKDKSGLYRNCDEVDSFITNFNMKNDLIKFRIDKWSWGGQVRVQEHTLTGSERILIQIMIRLSTCLILFLNYELTN